MFSRGNATSGAPICSGISALAKPANSGVANSSSMIVPCIVNSWLYCSGLSHDLQAGLDQLGADQQGQQPAEHEEDERGDEVQVADDLVVGGGDPLDDGLAGRQLARARRLAQDGGRLGGEDRPSVAAPCCGCRRWARTAAAAARAAPGSGCCRAAPIVARRPAAGPCAASYSALRDDLDLEQHLRVVGAAELGALALEGAGLGRDDLEPVDLARDHVHLLQERGHPEGVDDVARGQDELDPLVDRQVQGREASSATPGLPVSSACVPVS